MAADTKPVETGTINLPRDLLKMAKVISAHTGETMTQIVTDAARPEIERRHEEATEKLSRDLGGDSGGA